jgi:hypothetical protein
MNLFERLIRRKDLILEQAQDRSMLFAALVDPESDAVYVESRIRAYKNSGTYPLSLKTTDSGSMLRGWQLAARYVGYELGELLADRDNLIKLTAQMTEQSYRHELVSLSEVIGLQAGDIFNEISTHLQYGARIGNQGRTTHEY